MREYVRLFRPHPSLARHLPRPGEGLRRNAMREYVRLFRPHPSLARHLPHPGEGFFRLYNFFSFCFSITLVQFLNNV